MGIEVAAVQFERVCQACRAIDRDPGELAFSNTLVLCCGRSDAEIASRAAKTGHSVEELRAIGAGGSPAELVDTIGRCAEIGASRIFLAVNDIDLDHLELVASQVMPQLN